MIKFLKKVSFVYMADTPWVGAEADKLYLQSGQFTSTVKDSEDVSFDWARGICWDDTNTPWCGDWFNKLYLQSGQFTSTIKISQSVTAIDTGPQGISIDDTNTPWIGITDKKLYLTSGHFTSTIKDSESIGGIDTFPYGISFDGTNTPWIGDQSRKLYLQSGQFTSTLKDSEYVGGTGTATTGISWDGTNTPWVSSQKDKLYLQSGQFTSTLKESEDISGIDVSPQDISTNDYTNRVGDLLDQSIIDSLSISDQIDTDIIRVPLLIQPITNILTISDGVLGYVNDSILIIDPLVITDIINVTINVISIIDYFAITDIAYQPTIYSKSIIDTLTISDAFIPDYNVYRITNNLIIEQYVDLNNEIERIVANSFIISDIATVDTAQFAFNIIDNLIITDNIIEKAPRLFIIEDTLNFTDNVSGIFQYNISIEDKFDVLFIDTENLIVYRIMDNIERQFTANRSHQNFLSLGQDILAVLEKTGATEDSATNTLTITDEATVARSLNNNLTISDSISVTQGRLIKDTLSISDNINITKESNKEIEDTLILKLTVDYTHIKSHTHHEYAPFVGISTDPSAPAPPSLIEPATVKYTNVQLSYPITSPTDVLTLDGPELNNQDQLGFTRISRETRGGTLVIFADPNWPKREQYNLQFIGLSETESQNILNFLRDTLGKQIRLRDWEGNSHIVVTLTPDNPIIRNGDCQNSVSLDFEGINRTFDREVSTTISLGQTVSLANSTFNKSRSNTISLGQITSLAGSTYNLSISNTISLSQEAIKLNLYSLTSTITIGQSIASAGSIFDHSKSNTISLGQIVSPAGSTFNLSISNTISFGHVAIEDDSIFDRSLSNTISLGHANTPNLILNKSRSNTISLGQTVSPAGSTYNLSISNTITFSHNKIINYSLDHGSLMGLADVADHPGYLLANGSRDLTGNLAVDNGITIDGRDISVDGTALDATVAIEGMVGVDAEATPGYLGAANNDGVLRIGAGLSYTDGGNFITIAMDIPGLDADTIAAADLLVFYDDGDAHNKITFADFESTLSHDNLADYTANEHIDHVDYLPSMTNNNAGTVYKCHAVYCDDDDDFDLAQADGPNTPEVIGLIESTSIITTASGIIRTEGILTATTGQWDVAAGTSGGLTAGTEYYLSDADPGMLTSTEPSLPGSTSVRIGIALSTTKLKLLIATSVAGEAAALPIITENITLYITTGGDDVTGDSTEGNPWATLAQALAWLSDKLIAAAAIVTIQIDDGLYEWTSTDTLDHINGDKINIVGKNTYSLAMASVTSSGSAGAWSVVLTVDDSTDAAVGDFVLIPASISGGTVPYALPGCWIVTAVSSGTPGTITVTSTNRHTTGPTGVVSATVILIKTMLQYTGCDGITIAENGKLGLIDKLVVKGGSAANEGIHVLANGFCRGGTSLGVWNFTHNILARSGGHFDGDYLISSNAATNGLRIYYATARAANGVFSGCGSKGVDIQTGNAILSSCIATGNVNYGVYALDGSTLALVSARSHYNDEGVYVAYSTYCNAAGATISANVSDQADPNVNTEGNILSYIRN